MFGLITEKKAQELLLKQSEAKDAFWALQQEQWRVKNHELATDFSTHELIMGHKCSGKTTFVKEAILKHHPNNIIYSTSKEYRDQWQNQLPMVANKTDLTYYINEKWVKERKLLVIDGLESVANIKPLQNLIFKALSNRKNHVVSFVFILNNPDAFIPKKLRAIIAEACNYRCYYFTGKHDNFEPTVRKIQPPHYTTSAPNFQLF